MIPMLSRVALKPQKLSCGTRSPGSCSSHVDRDYSHMPYVTRERVVEVTGVCTLIP